MKTIIAVLFGSLALSSLAQVTGPGAGPPGVTNPVPTLTNTLPVTSYSIADANEVVWLQDSTPAGATLSAAPDDAWVWTNVFWDGRELVGPYSGSLMHLSAAGDGWRQHYFGEAGLWAVNPGDALITYIYLPWSNAPSTVLVQWLVAGTNGGAGTWQGPAFWGVDNVRTAANTNGFYGGPLPTPGQWVRLSVPAILVGLDGQNVQGISFATYDGAAAWDRAGRLPAAAPGEAGSNGGAGVGTAQSSSSATTPAGLVAWWKGERNAVDSVGNNNGVAYGNLSYPTGAVAYAFGLDAYSANVSVPDSPALRFTRTMSVEAWIMPTVSGARAIVGKWDMVTNVNQRAYNLYLDANGYASFTVSADGSATSCGLVTSDYPVPTNAWTHVAATYDGSNLGLYLDGTLQATVPWTNGIYAGTDDVGIGGCVGGGGPGQVGAPFGGEIDEVSLYSSALTGVQIGSIYQAGSAGKEETDSCTPPDSSIVAWWRGEYNTLDSVGGNNGTGYFMDYTNGEVGQAFSLNGSDANVNVPDAQALRFTTAMTVEAWVMPIATGARAILSKWDMVNGINQRAYNLYISNGIAIFTVSADGTPTNCGLVRSTNHMTYNMMEHLAATYDGTNLTLYMQGVPQAAVPWTKGIYAGTDDVGIGGCVGGGSPGQVGAPFGGLIDEASLYSRALSGAEIEAIRAADTAGKCIRPDILIAPDSQSVAAGANVSFSVGAGSTAPMSYQWTLNGSNIPGATNSIYAINNVQTSQAGAYAVVVSDLSGSATSPGATLAVGSYNVWVSQPMGNCNVP